MEVLKYKGTGPVEVEVPGCGIVRRGQTIHVPDELAEELVRNRPDDWEYDKPKGKAAKKTAEKGEE